jgi:hypothetical protein
MPAHYGSVVDEPQLSLNMSVVWVLEFSKNHGFSLKCFRIKEFLSSNPLFEKKSESMNHWPKLSPKPERTCDFHERTDKDSAVF